MRPLLLVALLALVSCQSAPANSIAPRGASGSAAPSARKVLTVAALASYKGFGPQYVTTTGGGSRQLNEIHSVGLLTTDAGGAVIPRLLRELPSLDNGDMVLIDDGRMQTTYRLRSDVTWQDGAPFTAEDVVFGWQVAIDPRLDVRITPTVRQIDSMEALDPLSVRFTWKSPYFHAVSFNINELWPLPRHILGDAHDGDADAFMHLPYWTSDYVHLGPFRLTDFGLGENLVFERFDGYFLGRPKLDEIRIHVVPDPNVVYANLAAGAVDVAGEGTLSTDVALQLRDEWARSGAGTVVSKQGNLFFMHVQFNPDYQRLPELRERVAVRRGLLQSVDRDALREAILPGVSGTEPTTFMTAGDPRAPLVGTPFARYSYDPRGALAELQSVGWQKDPDGRIVSQTGEQVTLPVRSGASGSNEPKIIAQAWRDLGFQVDEETIPGSLLLDRSYRATFPGLEYSAQANNEGVLARFDSRNCPRPPRFQGAPDGCYDNPAYDALIDRLYGTLDVRSQGLALRDIGELLATELPMLPMIFQVTFAAARAHVHAITDDFLGSNDTGPGQESRDAHL